MIRKIKGDTMANVQTELARILRDIREKTGVQIRLAPGKGEETSFSLEYGGERMTAYLDGTGKEAERTAKLAAYLVSGADGGVTTLKSAFFGTPPGPISINIFTFARSNKNKRDR